MTTLAGMAEHCDTCGAELEIGQIGKCDNCLQLEVGDMSGVSPAELEAEGITDYCNQVCGGGACGPGRVCQFGIDHRTNMPATADVLALVRR